MGYMVTSRFQLVNRYGSLGFFSVRADAFKAGTWENEAESPIEIIDLMAHHGCIELWRRTKDGRHFVPARRRG